MNDSALRVCRVLCLLLSAALCLCACVLLIVGVSTPSWLFVDYRLSDGAVEEHRHGLWLDCVLRGPVNLYPPTSYYGFGSTQDQCEYKWVNLDSYQYGGGAPLDAQMSTLFQTDYAQHRFLNWHVTTLVLMLIAIGAGLFAICACLCVVCTGLCSPVAAVLEFIAFICSSIGIIVFFVNANRPEIRYTQIPTAGDRWRINEGQGGPWRPPGWDSGYFRPGWWGGPGGFGNSQPAPGPALGPQFAQQQRGFSFDLAFASVFLFLLSFVVGLLGSVVVFMHAHRRHQRRHLASKTYPKSEVAISTVSAQHNDHLPIRAHSPAIDV